MSDRVREILSWYGSDNPGTLTNLARLLNAGTLAGTGRFVILPVDQGVEHGPARSFAVNPDAYDPRYHFELAIAAGCNAYAAPLGFIEAGAREFAGRVPLILKTNNHDVLLEEKDPNQAITGSVKDALRLGCVAIGFTIYPGSEHRLEMYEEIRDMAVEAKANGLAVVIWSYPRGSGSARTARRRSTSPRTLRTSRAARRPRHQVKLPSAHLEQRRQEGLRVDAGADRHAGRARAPRSPGRLQRPAHRDLLGRRRQQGRGGLRRGARHPRRRRLRLDHRAQLVPAEEARGAQVPVDGHGHLRGDTEVA